MAAAKPVLISGAGIASLLLAQLLKKAGIPFTMFERDASFSFRAQGYRLLLNSDSIDAVESVLDTQTFEHFWDRCGKTSGSGFTTLNAVTGEEIERVSIGAPGAQVSAGRGGVAIGISRGDMRQVFAEGMQDHIQWSKKVTGYELTDDGVKAIFANGSKSVEGCMLVGGEGVYSKVARQVSGGRIKVYDTGARGIQGQASSTAYKSLGEGIFRLRDDANERGSVFIITNVRSGDMDNPDISFGWTMGGSPGAISAPNDDYSIVGPAAADMAKDITKNWHPRFRPMVEEMNEAGAAFWKITCSAPSGVPEWPNEPRVTLVGDAAHSMTPAAGLGANTAVKDAVLLGKLIIEAGGFKPGVTAAYEKEMRVYASDAVAKSYAAASSAFSLKIDEDSTPVLKID